MAGEASSSIDFMTYNPPGLDKAMENMSTDMSPLKVPNPVTAPSVFPDSVDMRPVSQPVPPLVDFGLFDQV